MRLLNIILLLFLLSGCSGMNDEEAIILGAQNHSLVYKIEDSFSGTNKYVFIPINNPGEIRINYEPLSSQALITCLNCDDIQ